jgi:hypothetical protein
MKHSFALLVLVAVGSTVVAGFSPREISQPHRSFHRRSLQPQRRAPCTAPSSPTVPGAPQSPHPVSGLCFATASKLPIPPFLLFVVFANRPRIPTHHISHPNLLRRLPLHLQRPRSRMLCPHLLFKLTLPIHRRRVDLAIRKVRTPRALSYLYRLCFMAFLLPHR